MNEHKKEKRGIKAFLCKQKVLGIYGLLVLCLTLGPVINAEAAYNCTGVSAGFQHTCVLKSDGNVYCFGRNNWGQAADYTGGDAVQVDAGNSYTCVLKTNGNVDCYGANSSGQAADYTGGDAVQVAAGNSHTCVRKTNGNVDCYGNNSNGQAEDSTLSSSSVSVNDRHTCIMYWDISLNRYVHCYGKNDYGEASDFLAPPGVVDVSTGWDHTCVEKPNGNVACYGDNYYGQAADYTGGDAVKVSAGGWHTCVLKSDGNVDCYGLNNYGEAADYTGGDAVRISAATTHTCVLKSDGNVKCYGRNNYGQTNVGDICQIPVPTVTTSTASSITTTAATLNGTVNPNGQNTTFYFEYGTTESYGSTTSDSSAGSGTSVIPVSKGISGLTPNTTYHYRLVASSGGTGYGDNSSFTTSSCSYSILPISMSFGASGGAGTVNVTTPSGCSWTASSIDGWITITSGSSGSGNGAVGYEVASNPITSSRTGTMTIAGQTVTINQAGSNQYILTTSVSPTGGGSVSPDCSGGCPFNIGTQVTLTANANSGYEFNSWSGCDSPSGAICTMTMTSNKFVTVTFTSVAGPVGYMITNDLWIRSVINTVEKGPVEALWRLGGDAWTARGDRVIWGHFYASPSDVEWGSADNPDLFVKIWFDVSGRVDVNYFHVSVPNIDVFSDYPYDGVADVDGITTMDRRYIRHYYQGGNSYYEENYEDGLPASGYLQTGNPVGYNTINNLRIGSIINTVEKGPIEAMWRFGGQDTTARGDQVVWGLFYASPSDVAWGSSDNPDLYVKIWFDIGGWTNVNFFFVSVPDIEVYSAFPWGGTYHRTGTTILSDRYIRHDY